MQIGQGAVAEPVVGEQGIDGKRRGCECAHGEGGEQREAE
jgi:hypothetical protein